MSKTVWITGAGKGIGRALALKMAANGWTVAASARTIQDLDSLVNEGPAGRIHAYPLDITDQQASAAAFERIEHDLGMLDVTILNAGTYQPMSAQQFDGALVRHLFETNVMGTVNCLEAVLPAFRGRGAGHIAVVASVAGYRGLPQSAAYGATKAALINMCEALKPELDRDNVRLSLINPGFVDTPLTSENEFPMPFLVSSERAADEIFKGLSRNRFETVFPAPFAFLMKLLRLLPNWLLFRITSRMIPS